jgi:hypothetical protein
MMFFAGPFERQCECFVIHKVSNPGVTMSKFFFCGSVVSVCFVLVACGGGSSSTPTPPGPSFTASNVQGQYEVLAQSSVTPGAVLLVEANFTQTGNDAFAGKPSVVLIQGTQDSTGITPTSLGGECDNNVTGGDSIQGTFSSATQFSYELTQSGDLGTGTTSGSVTFSADGSRIITGTYTTPAACGFSADSGTLTGAFVKPFSGSYAGMLDNGQGTNDAVIVTVSQNAYSITVSGTDNGTPFTLNGSAVGATFDVTGTVAGQAVQYVGVYESVGNDFVVFDANLSFLGRLNAGTNPQNFSKTIGQLKMVR